MKIKVSEASGRVLDWLVAKCEGATDLSFDTVSTYWTKLNGKDRALGANGWSDAQRFAPSSEWLYGGPIIERNKINLQFCRDLRDRNGLYIHAEMDTHSHHGYWLGSHDKPLIAAMRCYVVSKLGEEVEVPDEL